MLTYLIMWKKSYKRTINKREWHIKQLDPNHFAIMPRMVHRPPSIIGEVGVGFAFWKANSRMELSCAKRLVHILPPASFLFWLILNERTSFIIIPYYSLSWAGASIEPKGICARSNFQSEDKFHSEWTTLSISEILMVVSLGTNIFSS